MRRSTNEIDSAIAKHFQRVVYREDGFQLHIQAFFFEKAQLNRGDSRKVGVRDQVWNSDFH